MAGFVRHSACDACGSSDGRANYDDGSFYCFVCGDKQLSEEYLEQLKDGKLTKIKSSVLPKKEQEKKEVNLKLITDDQKNEIKEKTQVSAGGYRGIKDEVLAYFGVRTELDDDNFVEATYYPVTYKGELSGYKRRKHPKNFSSIGETGKECDLFGAFRFPNGGKYVLITGGEHDQLAAYQMFKEYAESKGSDFITAVVSPTVGETGCSKQLQANYEFLDKFENIILGFDNDEAGEEAVQKAISVLPKGKVKVAKWSKAKDPNEYLEKGMSKQFLQDFYNAEVYVPVGVLGSSKLYDRMLQKVGMPKIPFAPLFRELNEMFVGGLSLGYIINIAADTGVGKTTLVNELIYYWIFNSPYKVGVLSMELDDAQYGEVLLSRHIEKKLALLPDEEKREFIRKEEVATLATELFRSPDGSDRFYLIDNRDGDVQELQDAIEQMVISAGCKVIVIDVLQDLLDGLSNEEQAVFMKWAKSLIKSHGITLIFINHKRKSQQGVDKKPGVINMDESDIHGSSTIIKSAGANILLGRDKMAEDPIIKNTTIVGVSKNRMTGMTGPAGALYYDNQTHKLHNFEDYHGITFQEYLESKQHKKE